MSKVELLEAAVRELSAAEREEFRAWFAAFEADEWDRQLEADVASGALDWLRAEAAAEHRAGRCTER